MTRKLSALVVAVFQVVGLVDDQVVVFRQDPAAGGHIGQQQGVVDDQEVGALGGLAGPVEGAGAAGALDADLGLAAFVLGGDAHPDIALGRAVQVDLAAVAAAAVLAARPAPWPARASRRPSPARAGAGSPAGAGTGSWRAL